MQILNTLRHIFDNANASARDSLRKHFGLYHRALYLRLPLANVSLWLEWREQSVGFGIERMDGKTVEFFAGRIQGVLSIERNSIEA